ncbi:PaaI family thioesterase [Sphingomonas sp. BE137]|jgi:uncharacterized protein (TIGR00369 family)|uniref:PaaI family thioesterase n=1 Tax=Sphingomonas sp. BE137 TaxID=2817844 RepID=UPI001AEB2F01|nr:PaaI family thioesterase [Sphingomonas sp. BE137]MDR6848743.1 uncharacterized protein (TIGR00369 family) [Sphingomonas sp. BE137]
MSVFDTFARPPCAETLGWRLIEADPDTGTVRVAMEGKPAFCNPGGTIQGGFVAAMLDDTLGPTILVKSNGTHYCATIDLHVSYLAPARPGAFTGVGRIVQMGKTIAFLEGELFDADNRCVARATASARVIPTTNVPRA